MFDEVGRSRDVAEWIALISVRPVDGSQVLLWAEYHVLRMKVAVAKLSWSVTVKMRQEQRFPSIADRIEGIDFFLDQVWKGS